MAKPRTETKEPTDFDVALGRRVQRHRKDLKLSQTEFGKHIGVSFQQVQKYESGANRIPAERLTMAARIFGVSVAALMNEAEAAKGIYTDFMDVYQQLGPEDREVLLVVAKRLAAR